MIVDDGVSSLSCGPVECVLPPGVGAGGSGFCTFVISCARQRVNVLDAHHPRQRAARAARQRGHAVRRVGSAIAVRAPCRAGCMSSEEHTSELQSIMRISYAVFCLKKKNTIQI